MYGLFDHAKSTYCWAKSKYNKFPSHKVVLSTVKETCTQLAALGQAVYNSIDAEAKIQRWEGFSRIMDPTTITFYARKPQVRTVIKQAIRANLIYMLPLFSYEMFKYYFYDYVYDPEHTTDNSYTAYTAYLAAWAVNTSVDIIFSPLWVSMSVDNIFHNGNVTTIVSNENPDPEHKKTCGCEKTDIIFANVASVIHYNVDMAALWMLEKTIPFGLGKYVMYPFRMRINGRALTEMNLSKMCTKHRNEILAKNNGFSDGIGFAYQLTVDFICWVLGVKHKFIYDPLSYMVFQVFALVSLLTNKPLPGKTEELDFLYYVHNGMNMILNQLSKGILSYLNTDSGGCDFILVSLDLEQFIPNILVAEQKISEKDLIKSMSENILNNLDTLAGKSNNAYILTKDQYLFYLDKKKKTCTYIEISNEKHGELRSKLLHNMSFETKEASKCLIDKLSIEQLQLMTAITNHVRQLDWSKLVKKVVDFPPAKLAKYYLIDDIYLAIFEGYRFCLLSSEVEAGIKTDKTKLELGHLYLKPEAAGFSYMLAGMTGPESIKKEDHPSLKNKDTSTFDALELLKDEISQIVADKGHPPIEAVIKLPPIKLFLDLNAPAWRSTIEEIKSTKEAWWPYIAQTILNQYTPASYENSRALLQIILNEKSDSIIKQLEQLLNIYGKYHQGLKEKINAEIVTARTVKKIEARHQAFDSYKPKLNVEEVETMIKELIGDLIIDSVEQVTKNGIKQQIAEAMQTSILPEAFPKETLSDEDFTFIEPSVSAGYHRHNVFNAAQKTNLPAKPNQMVARRRVSRQ